MRPPPGEESGSGRMAEAAAVLAFILLWAVFFRNALLCRGVFFHYDHALQNFPFRQFFAEGLRQGQLRLWTHDIFCGFPLFAESQGNALYPPFLGLFLLLPSWVAYNYYTALHFLMAGLAAYALARVMHLGRAPALVAGLVYMLAGPLLFHAHHTNIVVGVAWLPVLLLLLELIFRRPTARRLVLFAGAAAALALGSQPQYTIYNALVCGLFVLWRSVGVVWREENPRRAVHVLAGLAGAGLLAGLLAGVQVLPLMELVGHSSRSVGAGGATPLSPTVPGNLMTFFLPRYFGAPGLASYWGCPYPGIYSEVTLFLGVAPLFLAAVGLGCDRKRRTLLFAALGAFGLLFAMGNRGLLYSVLRYVPLLGSGRFPQRFAYVLALSVGMLAACGLQALLEGEDRVRLQRTIFIGMGLVLALGGACVLVAHLCTGELAGMDAASLESTLESAEGAVPTDIIRMYLHHTLPTDLLRLAGVLTVGTGLLMLGALGRLRGRWMAGAWIVLIFVELALAGYDFVPVTSPNLYQEPPHLARRLHELMEAEPGRLYRTDTALLGPRRKPTATYPQAQGWAVSPGRYVSCLDRMPPNSNMLWRLPSVNGFSPLQTHQLRELLDRPRTRYTVQDFGLHPPTLNLVGARYVLSGRQSLPAPYEKIDEMDGLHLFRNPAALPPAFIVHNGREPGPDPVKALLREDFPYRELVLVEDPATPLSAWDGTADPAENVQPGPTLGNAMSFEAYLVRPGYLVITSQKYPGWKATVDGNPVPVLRANHALMAVRLNAGQHSVRLRFDPASFRWGLWLTVLGLVLAGAWLVVDVRHPLRMGTEPTPDMNTEADGRSFRRLLVFTLVLFALGIVATAPYWFGQDVLRNVFQQLTPPGF